MVLIGVFIMYVCINRYNFIITICQISVRTFNDLNISNSHYGKSTTGNEKLAKNFQSSLDIGLWY